MARHARKLGFDAIVITDHQSLFPWSLARELTRDLGICVIPGIEGGNIVSERHWIAAGINHPPESSDIGDILSFVRREGGVSIAPHPFTRLGYAEFTSLGFDGVENLNSTTPRSNRLVPRDHGLTPLGGSDAHACPMLGYAWSEVDSTCVADDILEAVRKGLCRPAGGLMPAFLCVRQCRGLIWRHVRDLPVRARDLFGSALQSGRHHQTSDNDQHRIFTGGRD
jgi:hypothetical protein